MPSLDVDTPAAKSLRERFMKVPSFGPLEETDCPLCGPGPTTLVAMQPMFGENFRVIRCNSCHLIFTNPRPTAEWKSHFYDPAYNQYIELQKREFVYCPDMGRVPGYERLCDFLLTLAPRGSRLLDVGCATGLFVKVAADKGFAAQGSDYSQKAVDYGREHLGVDLFASPIENMTVPDNTYDVVTLLHVYEHLPHPVEVLREIRRILKPGGIMFLETVNYSAHYYIERYLRFLIPLYGKLTRREGLPWVPFDHLFHWSPATMRKAIQQAGLAEGKCHYLRGYRSEAAPDGKFTSVYRLCGRVGEVIRGVTLGKVDLWPVLIATARKPL